MPSMALILRMSSTCESLFEFGRCSSQEWLEGVERRHANPTLEPLRQHEFLHACHDFAPCQGSVALQMRAHERYLPAGCELRVSDAKLSEAEEGIRKERALHCGGQAFLLMFAQMSRRAVPLKKCLVSVGVRIWRRTTAYYDVIPRCCLGCCDAM